MNMTRCEIQSFVEHIQCAEIVGAFGVNHDQRVVHLLLCITCSLQTTELCILIHHSANISYCLLDGG
jgi:hypothetical protein